MADPETIQTNLITPQSTSGVAGKTHGLVTRVQGEKYWDIRDKDRYMKEIDEQTGFPEGPKVEYIFCHSPKDGGQSTSMIFGHAAVRYRFRAQDGTEIDNVVNIGNPDHMDGHLVELYENPADFFLGYDNARAGVFKETMSTIRIKDVPDEGVEAMHHYYRALAAASKVPLLKRPTRRVAEFATCGGIWNFFDFLLPLRRMKKRGNCAQWVSEGLYLAGLLRKPHIWPKEIWADLFENHILDHSDGRPTGAKIVVFKQAECSRWRSVQKNVRGRAYRMSRLYEDQEEPRNSYQLVDFARYKPIISFTQWLRGCIYRRMERFADVTVTIDDTELLGLMEETSQGMCCLRRRIRSRQVGVSQTQLTEVRERLGVQVIRHDQPPRPRICRAWITWWFHDIMLYLIAVLWIVFGWPTAHSQYPAILGRVFIAFFIIQTNGALESA